MRIIPFRISSLVAGLLVLVLLAALAPAGPALAQDLDDFLARPAGDDSPVVEGPGGPGVATVSSELWHPVSGADVYLEFSRGVLSLEQLVSFLERVLARLLAILRGDPLPPVVVHPPGEPAPVASPPSGQPGEGPARNPPPVGPRPPAATSPAGTAHSPAGPDTESGPDTEPGPGHPPTGSDDGSRPPGQAAAGGAFTGFPARPAGAETGSQFLARTEPLGPAAREEEIRKAILAGNVPPFLRRLCEVRVTMRLRDGKEHTAVFRCLPDYLCIGTDEDFVRIPMSPIAGQVLADRFGCLLPTAKMVDEIYRQAAVQLLPQPMSSGAYANWQARMTKNEFYREHQRLVESQRTRTGHRLGDLLAGHKKDVLISNFLDSHRKNVVIYGWHDKRNQGKPIQGYGFSHENTYADYSHGIRLVSRTVTVDGVDRPIAEVLGDPVLSRLLSNEGPMRDLRAVR
ncbi:MAG: hypothetical protein GX442_06520 [Candidatus Riflebacteria bacterium]|nr:hypothetical protein [Candidatus Riflebacteria bacterium]